MEMRPKTLTANIASMSASEMSPTRSTPSTKPALFTVPRARAQRRNRSARGAAAAAQQHGAKGREQARTENVDVAEVRGDVVEE